MTFIYTKKTTNPLKMNLQLLTYIFFQSVLTAADDKQYESDVSKKCITNPSTNSPHSEIESTDEENSLEKAGKSYVDLENSHNFEDKESESKKAIDQSEDVATFMNINESTELNDEEARAECETAQEKLHEMLMSYIQAVEYESKEPDVECVAITIPDDSIIDMNYINEKKIPFKLLCDLHISIVPLFNFICSFEKLNSEPFHKAQENIQIHGLGLKTQYIAIKDTKNQEKLKILLSLFKHKLKYVVDFTLYFFTSIIYKNDTEVTSFLEVLEKIKLYMTETFKKEYISVIEVIKNEYIDRQVQRINEIFQNKEKEFKKIFNSEVNS